MTKATVLDQPVIAPLEERTRARLEELKSNRERFMVEAQRNLAALDAAIAEFTALLDPDSVSQNGASEPGG
jgi:uncharacterized protein YPO0396